MYIFNQVIFVEAIGSRTGSPTIIGSSSDLRNHTASRPAPLTPVGGVVNSSTDDVTLLLGEWQEDTTFSQKVHQLRSVNLHKTRDAKEKKKRREEKKRRAK